MTKKSQKNQNSGADAPIGENKRWWISWWQPFPSEDCDDVRPLAVPLPKNEVVDWWISGESSRAASICAVVIAPTEEAAKRIIISHWDAPNTVIKDDAWRFCEPKPLDFMPEPTRFPPASGSNA